MSIYCVRGEWSAHCKLLVAVAAAALAAPLAALAALTAVAALTLLLTAGLKLRAAAATLRRLVEQYPGSLLAPDARRTLRRLATPPSGS